MISKKNILDFEARRNIYEFVEGNPGLNVGEISRRMEIPFTTLFHHLSKLEKQELIELKSKGRDKLAYAKFSIGVEEKKILELLREKIPCRILLHLFLVRSCTQNELSKELNLHPATVSYHLKKMIKKEILVEDPVENGIIHLHPGETRRIMIRKPKGREIFYRYKNLQTILTIRKIMIANKNSLEDSQYIDEFFSMIKSLSDEGFFLKHSINQVKRRVIKKNGKKVTYKVVPEGKDFYDHFLDIFRPPFCA